MRRWISSLFRAQAISRTNRDWWASIAETGFAAALLLSGVVVLALFLTLAVLYSTPAGLYISIGHFSLQLIVATIMIGIGAYRIVWLLWKVGVSAERRGAIVSRAGEIELLNEIRQRREDLPTVPLDRFPPRAGERLNFELVPSPRNVWALVVAWIFTVGFVALATILISTAVASVRKSEPDWLAVGLAVPISLAAFWSIYQFIRQLLKLTGIGATILQVSGYPLVTGTNYQAFISQTGRVRLRLLDVCLICEEEATYNQGTDIRTEKAIVFDQRLFRRRGIWITPDHPFEADFSLIVPADRMHAFKSANNRVQWKIVVTAQAKNWPRLNRVFAISVHPNPDATNKCFHRPTDSNEQEDNSTKVRISFDQNGNPTGEPLYQPDDFLICEYQVDCVADAEVNAIEVSVLWSTEGKGEEDIGVHFFERKKALPQSSYFLPHKLSTVLPATPLSYYGRILKVKWFVRVKVFLADGQTVIENQPFQLGPGLQIDMASVEPTENVVEGKDESE